MAQGGGRDKGASRKGHCEPLLSEAIPVSKKAIFLPQGYAEETNSQGKQQLLLKRCFSP